MKFGLYLIVLFGLSSATAGSYEDFFAAIQQDNPSAITSLLRRGFDPNTPDPKGVPGLYVALREGSMKAADALIYKAKEKGKSQGQTSSGRTFPKDDRVKTESDVNRRLQKA